MSEFLESLKKLIDGCSDDERSSLRRYLSALSPHSLETEWGIDADTILSAIRRSSDLTKRGVRGIIAEAVFVDEVVLRLAACEWRLLDPEGDRPYDAVLKKDDLEARIQVKLQRLEDKAPKLYYPRHYEEGSLFVVEVQKTRTGEKRTKKKMPGTNTTLTAMESVTVKTRPYSFGDFDILAVNMHPSSRDWRSFRYTVASWLLPRSSDRTLIEIFQPVAAFPNAVWTDDLATCLQWLASGDKRSVLEKQLHPRGAKKRKGRL